MLSDGVKMYMYLFKSKRYYALDDRTINLLMKGTLDMSATTSETAEVITDSGKEVVDLINVEQEVELFTIEKNKARAGGSFFPCLKITIFDLPKYDIFKTVDKIIPCFRIRWPIRYQITRLNSIFKKSSCS